MSGSINTDEHIEHVDGEYDAEDAFLATLVDDPKKKGPSKEDDEAPDSEEEDDASDETDGDSEDEADDKDSDEDTNDAEDGDDGDILDKEVEVKVGDKTEKVRIGELTRLYGQEAALTQKGQQLATFRAEAEAFHGKVNTALTNMVERAQEAWKPYSELDFALLAKNLDTETYTQLKDDAKRAFDNLQFLTGELDTVTQETQRVQAETNHRAALECVKELQDAEKGIPGFGPEVYNSMISFADQHGLPELRQAVNPAAFRLVNMAMQFLKMQEQGKAAETKLAKAVQGAKNAIKPSRRGDSANPNSKREALRRMQNSDGNTDSAADAFMATLTE